ncbi:MAG: ABC transporter ATP-binding protein, partial [Deltaproteobacteria bacterium]
MLRLESLTLTVGTVDLLVDVDWHLRPGRRVGLVGRNGVGKTSLLRVIAGELAPSAGRVHLRGGVRPGTLPQQAVSGSSATVWEEASSRMDWLHTLEARLRCAQADVDAGVPGAIERLGQVTEQMRLRGAYAAEERIGEVLHGLGFRPEDWHRPCNELSGGWQMRVALARLLLSEPELLLLDEPTNHLDIAARTWLAGFLADSGATMIVVSHDRFLLDTVCTDILELRHRRATAWPGNLSTWLVERQRRQQAQEAAHARQQAEIDRLQRFVDRFGAKATKAAQARSRQKVLDRIERIEAPETEGRPTLRLPDAPAGALQPVRLVDADLGFGDGPPVLRGVSLDLERGQRLAVLGPNGCGKSTLLAGLAGTLRPRRGRRIQGRDVRLGRYAQDLAQELPPDLSAVDAVQQLAPLAPVQRVRQALGALGLQGDAQLRPVGRLSGGEKARVVLAGFACRPANLLLLDEPTNHLDAVTADELARALESFEGTLVLVTHDRWLVERLATHVAHIVDGRLEVHPGVRPDDFLPPARRAGSDGRAGSASVADGPSRARESWEERKARQRSEQRAARRLERLHEELEAAEARVEEIDAAMVEVATDPDALQVLV